MEKVLLILMNNMDEVDGIRFLKEETEHIKLQHQIGICMDMNLSTEQYTFLELLSGFIQNSISAKIYDQFYQSRRLLFQYISNHISTESLSNQNQYISASHIEKIRQHIEKMVGEVSRLYFNAIENEAHHRKMYTCVLRHKSIKDQYRHMLEPQNHLYHKRELEKRATIELLLYLCHHRDSGQFTGYIRQIQPLPFKGTRIREYFADLCNMIISGDLVREVETMYEGDLEWQHKRTLAINFLGEKGIAMKGEK